VEVSRPDPPEKMLHAGEGRNRRQVPIEPIANILQGERPELVARISAVLIKISIGVVDVSGYTVDRV
jgi:hypothetical protein